MNEQESCSSSSAESSLSVLPLTPATAASRLIPRYSRQMVVPSIGLDGQVALSKSSVLVIGAGGIGSTVLLYLAGAGVGHIGVLDFDVVEVSNLHRQIVHDAKSEKTKKCHSAVARMKALNTGIKITALDRKLTATNAIESFEEYDLIVDATDNFEARYTINDACVLLGKPLVSGSAVGLEGQITVFAPRIGPCYRCLYPSPSQLEGCRSCANAGVLGPVPGLIGCLQAVEVIKVLLSPTIMKDVKNAMNYNRDEHVVKKIKSNQEGEQEKVKKTDLVALIGRQIMYDGSSGEFHNFLLPAKNPSCESCSALPIILSMADSEMNLAHYAQRLTEASPSLLLPPGVSVSVAEYGKICKDEKHIQLDVRSATQFGIVSFNWYGLQGLNHQLSDAEHNGVESGTDNHHNGALVKRNEQAVASSNLKADIIANTIDLINFPFSEMKNMDKNDVKNEIFRRLKNIDEDVDGSVAAKGNGDAETETFMDIGDVAFYCICRRGRDSILATQMLRSCGFTNVYNVSGGLTAWSNAVDPAFPMY